MKQGCSFLRTLVSLLTAAALLLGSVPSAFAGMWPKKTEGVSYDSYVVSDAEPGDMTLEKTVTHPGTLVAGNGVATIDYSNASDGYIMVCYGAATSQRLKVQVAHSETYTYNIWSGVWAAFPLSEGSGGYSVSVFEEIGDSRYSLVLSAYVNAEIEDEFDPFLRPNQYVNYADAPNLVATAENLTADCKDSLEMVDKVYNFVLSWLSYDTELASTVRSGYLPDLDKDLVDRTGICFDYAAMMAGMLRCRGVPTKLVVGYAGKAYHSWLSIWSEETGWGENIVYFDGTSWQRMDPTYADTASSKKAAEKFIGDGTNYTEKYIY